jgi:hypothetical protein
VDLSIEAYAQVMAELASAGDARAAALARHGLDEARWEAIDARWQAEISAALDADDDGIPAILSAYAAAYEAAQRALAPPISIEQFARVTRLLQASGDVRASLAKVGVTLADYVRGSEHWSRRLAGDEELERRFQEALRGGGRSV